MHTRPLLEMQEDLGRPGSETYSRDLGPKRHQKRRMVLDEWRMGRHLLCVAVVSQTVTGALRICWCGWCPGSKLLPLSVANALRYVSRVRTSWQETKLVSHDNVGNNECSR